MANKSSEAIARQRRVEARRRREESLQRAQDAARRKWEQATAIELDILRERHPEWPK